MERGLAERLNLRRRGRTALLATLIAAALGCLQPGIDPVFLTLLSAAHPVDPTDHGWVVGATQSGMVIGSLIVWRMGGRLGHGIFLLSALVTLLASLATVGFERTGPLLLIRGVYGLGMGMIYTQAISAASAWRPNGAYGAVFLIQLLISTAMALVLPAIADVVGPGRALGALAIVPVLALALLLLVGPAASPPAGAAHQDAAERRYPVPPAAWALAAGSLLFICATMMVWSFTGALAVAAGIEEEVIGEAVAIGSIAGAATALAVMREKPLIPLPLTGLLSGLGLLAPIPAAASGMGQMFVAAIVALNIGSTAIIIRCSGMACARSDDPLFRRLVACTHSGGMILGPVTGSILTATFGDAGLMAGAITAITGGCAALLLAAWWSRERAADEALLAPSGPLESAA